MWIQSVSFLVFALITKLADGACKYKTPCACTTDNGKDINLASLKKLTVDDPVHQNDYMWEPCNNFDIGNLKGVTFVQHAETTDMYYDVGTDPNVSFQEDAGQVTLQIVSQPGDRQAQVQLNCSTKTELIFNGEKAGIGPITYGFTLNSPYCCPRPGYSGGSGLSIGSILTIIFFVLLVFYAVVGVVFQVRVRHAEGRERIPNVTFWSALPGLIRDGFKFTISCGRPQSLYGQI